MKGLYIAFVAKEEADELKKKLEELRKFKNFTFDENK